MENHLLCYTQSLAPISTKWNQKWPVSSSIVIYAATNRNWIVYRLCVYQTVHWAFIFSTNTESVIVCGTSRFWPFTVCHAWVKTSIWLIPSVSLKSVQKWKLSQSVLIGCIFIFLDESGCLVLGWWGRGNLGVIFHQYLVLMMGELEHCAKLLQHVPRILSGVQIWTLWWWIHVWKWGLRLCNVCNLSWMNPGIAIVEYAHVTREETHHWWNNLVIQCLQVSLLHCLGQWWATAATPGQSCPPAWSRWHTECFSCLSSYPLLEPCKSGLIRPHDLLPLLQSPIFVLSNKLKPFFSDYPPTLVAFRPHFICQLL